jgi:ferredoxin/flavodoxin
MLFSTSRGRVYLLMIPVYYFSGTGNSYAVARDISQRINGKLVSIPSVMKMDKVHVDSDLIGIVFPSYIAPIAGVPFIVERFAGRISDIKSKKIFAICTCGGYECVNAIPSLFRLQNIIKGSGGELSAKYSVRLPMNNLNYDHIPIPINRDTDEIIRKSYMRINDISSRIIKGKGTQYGFAKTLFYCLMMPVLSLMRTPVMRDLKLRAMEPEDSKLTIRELMPLTDKSIAVDDKCIGCGLCTSVCSVDNIRIVNNRPEFQHRCEVCIACDEWCPQNAIQHWSRAKGIKYHHPSVETPMYW